MKYGLAKADGIVVMMVLVSFSLSHAYAQEHDHQQWDAGNVGRLIAMARSSGLTCFESDDKGRSWRRTGVVTKPAQHPADLCLLANGHVLLVYGSRIWPYGVGAMVSRDGGRTWDRSRRVMLGWDSQNTDTGYPSAVQLDDGTIVVLYYAVGTEDLLPTKQDEAYNPFMEGLRAAAEIEDLAESYLDR